jgi:hypothetical protein
MNTSNYSCKHYGMVVVRPDKKVVPEKYLSILAGLQAED